MSAVELLGFSFLFILVCGIIAFFQQVSRDWSTIKYESERDREMDTPYQRKKSEEYEKEMKRQAKEQKAQLKKKRKPRKRVPRIHLRDEDRI